MELTVLNGQKELFVLPSPCLAKTRNDHWATKFLPPDILPSPLLLLPFQLSNKKSVGVGRLSLSPFYSALVGPICIAVCTRIMENFTVYFVKATLEESFHIPRLIGGAMVANSKGGGVAVDLTYFLFLSNLEGAFCFLVSLSPS